MTVGPAQATAPAILERFGPYSLLRKIGQGGMSEVFLANYEGQPAGSPPVVVKRLHQDLEKNADAVDLFLTEADVTPMLQHPNVIRVYDSGEILGRYYIAMEYVHGKDLEQLAARFRFKNVHIEPSCAVHLMIEVLSALHYVHEARTPSGRPLGLIHRDVTPSNIYVSATGTVKLGDFGVAKLVGFEGWTMAGSLKGKLGYLSPEQIAGEPLSQSIDLWAAGVILWELLAGERLFVGEQEYDVMSRIKAAKVPDVRKLNRDAPKPLAKIVERALHKKQRKRYATAGDFHDALVEYRAKEGRTYTGAELVQYITTVLA